MTHEPYPCVVKGVITVSGCLRMPRISYLAQSNEDADRLSCLAILVGRFFIPTKWKLLLTVSLSWFDILNQYCSRGNVRSHNSAQVPVIPCQPSTVLMTVCFVSFILRCRRHEQLDAWTAKLHLSLLLWLTTRIVMLIAWGYLRCVNSSCCFHFSICIALS